MKLHYLTLPLLAAAATAYAGVTDAPQWLPLFDNAPALRTAPQRAIGERSDEIDGVTFEVTSETECKAVRCNKGVNPDTRGPYLPYDYIMPEEVTIGGKSYTVTAIGDYVFSGAALKTITLPSTLRSIGEMTFNQCTILTSVDMPEGLTTLGQYCFYMCQKLPEISLPSTVTEIPYACFGHCTQLNTAVLDEGITSIGGAAFYNTNLQNVSLPASLATLGEGAFGMCPYMSSFTVADANPNYKSVDGMVLSKDGTRLVAVPSGVEEVNVPEGVTELGRYSFYYGVGNKYVVLPQGLKEIGPGAFFYANALKELNIPASVETIGGGAFAECESLTGLDIDAANPYFICEEGWVMSKDGQTLISGLEGYTIKEGGFRTIPESVTEMAKLSMCYSQVVKLNMSDNVTVMGDGALSQARHMGMVNLSRRLAHIGQQACVGWDKMTGTLTLPASLQTIGADAFKDTYQISNLVCLAENPPVIADEDAYAFYSNDITGTTLYLVKDAEDAYLNAWNWDLFTRTNDSEYILAKAEYDPDGCQVTINGVPGVPVGMEYRSQVTFKIDPIGSATIKSLLLNGKDVTDQLTADNTIVVAKADAKENQVLTVNMDNVAISGLQADSEAPAAYYDLMGRRVAQPQGGVYVKVQGGKSSKVAL